MDSRYVPGRFNLWAGLGLTLLVIGAYALQIQMRTLTTPWYVPIAGTLGLGVVISSLLRKRNGWRWLALGLCLCLTAAEWAFVLLSGVPEYKGPLQVGKPLPTFSATLASGEKTDRNHLLERSKTAVIFFRGRW